MSIIRVKQAADFLEVTPDTIRKWCNVGRLPFHMNVSGQRIFDMDKLIAYRNEKLGIEDNKDTPDMNTIAFYVRSSDNNDVAIETQIDILTKKFGEPDRVFKDKASGLNENRKGLKSLLSSVENKEFTTIAITNKDRLTRFGFTYIERLCNSHDIKIEVANSDEAKEPHEILMQDFMSLLASFSGKFYRLRGWKNQKRFLNDVEKEVKRHEQE